jgi:hypothetical protein
LIDHVRYETEQHDPRRRDEAIANSFAPLLRVAQYRPEVGRAASTSIPDAVMQGRNQSHRRLQDETKRHRAGRAIKDVLPNPIVNFDRESVPEHPENNKDGNERDSQPRQKKRTF